MATATALDLATKSEFEDLIQNTKPVDCTSGTDTCPPQRAFTIQPNYPAQPSNPQEFLHTYHLRFSSRHHLEEVTWNSGEQPKPPLGDRTRSQKERFKLPVIEEREESDEQHKPLAVEDPEDQLKPLVIDDSWKHRKPSATQARLKTEEHPDVEAREMPEQKLKSPADDTGRKPEEHHNALVDDARQTLEEQLEPLVHEAKQKLKEQFTHPCSPPPTANCPLGDRPKPDKTVDEVHDTSSQEAVDGESNPVLGQATCDPNDGVGVSAREEAVDSKVNQYPSKDKFNTASTLGLMLSTTEAPRLRKYTTLLTLSPPACYWNLPWTVQSVHNPTYNGETNPVLGRMTCDPNDGIVVSASEEAVDSKVNQSPSKDKFNTGVERSAPGVQAEEGSGGLEKSPEGSLKGRPTDKPAMGTVMNAVKELQCGGAESDTPEKHTACDEEMLEGYRRHHAGNEVNGDNHEVTEEINTAEELVHTDLQLLTSASPPELQTPAIVRKHLSIHDLDEVYTNLHRQRAQWFPIGLALGMDYDELDNINQECTDNSECLREMLAKRLKESSETTWQTIIDALNTETVGEEGAAADLLEYVQCLVPEEVNKEPDRQPTYSPVMSLAPSAGGVIRRVRNWRLLVYLGLSIVPAAILLLREKQTMLTFHLTF